MHYVVYHDNLAHADEATGVPSQTDEHGSP